MRSFRPLRTWLVLLVLIAAASVFPALAETSTESVYRTPPQALADIADAPPTPAVALDPRREWLLVLERPGLPPISELSERELRLAGQRIRPGNNGPSRAGYTTGLRLLRLSDLAERRLVGLPEEPRLLNVRWSPDGSRFAFTHTRPDGIELWVAEVASGQARRVVDARLNLVAEIPPQWLRDSQTLVCTLVPSSRGSEPTAPAVPSGPVIQENAGRSAPARTFQDLLKGPFDEALFEHYFTAQVARVSLNGPLGGQVTPLGDPGLIFDVLPSPDSRYLLVQTLHRPFSYLVPAFRFPRRTEVWDLDGKGVHTLADQPLQEEIPIAFDSVAAGPRGFSWREDAPATVFWVEALDGGDPRKEAAERDRLYLLPAPFQGNPVTLATLELRFQDIAWGSDSLALVEEGWWKTRRARTWRLRPNPAEKSEKDRPELLFDRSSEDRYADPGIPWNNPQRLGPAGAAHGGRRAHPLPRRRRRLPRRRPPVPRRLRPRHPEDPAALPVGGPLVRGSRRFPRRRGADDPGAARVGRRRRRTTSCATSRAVVCGRSPASPIPRPSSPASARS